MKKYIIPVILCFLLVLGSCSSKNKVEMATADSVSAATEDLQTQIIDLNSKLVAYNNSITQIESQMKTQKTSASTATKNIQGDIDELVENLAILATAVDDIQLQVTALQENTATIASLQAQITELQDDLRASMTTIGIVPEFMDDLSVVFITERVDIGAIGEETAGTAQFAIKIMNNTDKVLTNIDVTGTIAGSQSFAQMLAAGYPLMVDGSGLCSYTFSVSGSRNIRFEAYGSAKTGLSIPVGGSITLRPKITVLAVEDYVLPAMTFVLSLDSISYDVATTTK